MEIKLKLVNNSYCNIPFKHLRDNKSLNFSSNEKIISESGIYSFGEFPTEYDDKKSKIFDSHNRAEHKDEARKKKVINFFQERAIDNCLEGPILSVGAGTLYWDSKLAINKNFIPLDISRGMLQVAINKKRTNLAFHADGTSLPFDNNQFELTYCLDGLPIAYDSKGKLSNKEIEKHLKLRNKMLVEMYRVTKRGGKVCLLVANKNKTDLLNFGKKIKGIDYDRYGFSPSQIINEIKSLGMEIHYKRYEMNISPFRTKGLIDMWRNIIMFFKINFTGMLYMEIIVK